MKLVNYSKNSSQKAAILTDRGLIDISTLPGFERFTSVDQLLLAGGDILGQLQKASADRKNFLPVESVKLLAPVLRPGKIFGLAGNYSEHIKEVGMKLGLTEAMRSDTVPRPFIMPGSVIAGPDDTIAWPAYSEQIDYEIELAVVIGKQAKQISADKANEYIGGYTIANDISARSVTFSCGRKDRPWDEFFDWINGKWADGFLPIGPCLVTADEIPDPQKLEMNLKVNGQTRQNACTDQMIFSAFEIVSFLSQIMTLNPGDIIATGTPAGVGKATEIYLKGGDRIDCEIKKIGRLTNIIGQPPENFYKPCL